MSQEESKKRKTPEKEATQDGEISEEPPSKTKRFDDETSSEILAPNLKNDNSEGNATENETNQENNNLSIQISFADKSIADLYKLRFVKFLSNFIELEIESDELSISVRRDDSINPDEWKIIDELPLEIDLTLDSPSKTDSAHKKRKKKSKAKKELFVVDANPMSSEPVPLELRYTSKFVIGTENVEEEPRSMRQTCFNCDKFHSLKDCPEPKDMAKINAARQRFKQQQQKSTRYHLEEEQRYSHLSPGRVSLELRKALGLRKNDIPHYVYMMRRLGYPPGWLEEAKAVHSNLDLFDSDGNHLRGAVKKQLGLDLDKIVSFPGFNVPMEEGMKDDYKYYGVPPFSGQFSKEAMIKFYEEQFAKQQDDLESCDMELDSETASPIKNKHQVDVTIDSQSLNDLEKQKQELLEKLGEQVIKDDKDEPETPNKTSSDSEDSNRANVKTTNFGTPILKSNSQYITLPNADNFSKDVSPVINFENLPNSTGKYEQMVDVLQKVRSTLKKINNSET